MISSEEIGLRLAKVFGLDHVQSIAVIMNIGQPAKVVVTKLLDKEESDKITSIMEEYELKQKEEK